MAEFIDSVNDNRMRALLEVAINGTGAFRRFKDVIQEHPQERERWFAFQKDRRCGLAFVAVQAHSGAMGGTGSQEFMVRTDAGEDLVAACPTCGYAANTETARSRIAAEHDDAAPAGIERFASAADEVCTGGATARTSSWSRSARWPPGRQRSSRVEPRAIGCVLVGRLLSPLHGACQASDRRGHGSHRTLKAMRRAGLIAI